VFDFCLTFSNAKIYFVVFFVERMIPSPPFACSFFQDYEHLTLIQKIEVFEFALECMTSGQDLCKILWLKSRNSEVWLDRRTNYTRSLAVMSMVGYILGLGDRHPSNLMLDRYTGKVQHIDFGDCFEVAMHRDKYPEKVPFRLTRMLINAMEVSGIEGNFRLTCERVMRVLRDNKDSAMAMLEAFVHDPLINWRLLNTASPRTGQTRGPNITSQPNPLEAEADALHHHSPTPSRYVDTREQRDELDGDEEGGEKKEMLNQKAVEVCARIFMSMTESLHLFY
jgi:FKBP12-rapamycin complex-associated protein